MKHNVKQYLIKYNYYFNHKFYLNNKNVSLHIPYLISICLLFVEIYSEERNEMHIRTGKKEAVYDQQACYIFYIML